MATFFVYTDGSYRDGVWGAGATIVDEGGNILHDIYRHGVDEHGSRNIAGETEAVLASLRFLFKKYVTSNPNERHAVVIRHDYAGLQKWADGEWKANKPDAIAYKNSVDTARGYFNVAFEKIKAHSGNPMNDRADALAKKGVEKGLAELQAKGVDAEQMVTLTMTVTIAKDDLEDEFSNVMGFVEAIKRNTPVREITVE